MTESIKLSPIYHAEEKWQGQFITQAGWQVVQLFHAVESELAAARNGVALRDQSHNGRIRLEGQTVGELLQAEDLSVNGSQATADGRLYRLRPDLFFLCTAPAMTQTVVAKWGERAHGRERLITVTDVTHGQAELWLVGPGSADLLSRLCGLDFHVSRFPDGTAKQSSVAKTAQLIIRQDRGGLPAFGLIGARSLGMYLWQTLMEVGHDWGIEPMGQAAWDQLV